MENRQNLHVSIPKGANRPYRVRSSGKFYIRAGSSSVEPGTEELARLFQNGELLHYELKPVCGAGIGELNHSYIKTYLREHRLMDDIPESEHGFLQILVNLNFLAQKDSEFVPTVAGLILFGNAPEKFLPQCGIRAAAFSGDDEADEMVELKEFDSGSNRDSGSNPLIFDS
ncbi:MAG: hypothetical protein R2941_11385 [Desulfobacterales bacterium]